MHTETTKRQQGYPSKNSHTKYCKTTNFDIAEGRNERTRIDKILKYAIDINVSVLFPLKFLTLINTALKRIFYWKTSSKTF